MKKYILSLFMLAISLVVGLGQATPDAAAVSAMADVEATITTLLPVLYGIVVAVIAVGVIKKLGRRAV